MKKYLITIYNDLDGGISYEMEAKVFDNTDIKSAIIAMLQQPNVKVNVNDNILVQEMEDDY